MSIFAKWHSLATGIKVGGADDDKPPLTADEIANLRQQKTSLYALSELLRNLNEDALPDAVAFAYAYNQNITEAAAKKVEFTYDSDRTAELSVLLKDKIVKKFKQLEAVDEENDYVVYFDMRKYEVKLDVIKHENVHLYSYSVEEHIELHRRIMLFSTADVFQVDQMYQRPGEQKYRDQLLYFRSRNFVDLRESKGTMEDAKKLPQTVAGQPLSDFLSTQRKAFLKKAATESLPIAIVLSIGTGPVAASSIDSADLATSSRDEIENLYRAVKADDTLIVLLDMRDSYYRLRGWESGLLIWAGDEKIARQRERIATAPVKRKRTKALGSFEKGTHRLQATLNQIYRDKVPHVDAAPTVSAETLRLAVLAYQLAFDDVTLDSVLGATSGSTTGQLDVYKDVVRPRLLGFKIDPSTTIVRTEETTARFERFLETIVINFSAESETDDGSATVLPRLSTYESKLQSSFNPYLLEFFCRFFLQPFGPMTRNEERLRALLKARYLGKVSESDKNLFTQAEKLLAAGDAKEKFNQLTDVVEDLTRETVDNNRMFTAPSGLPKDQQLMFTRDMEYAHEYARRRMSKDLPLRLCEIYDIMTNRAELTYGEGDDNSLATYLFNKSRKRSASFYYTLKDGLFPGPPPRDAEERQNFVFTFIVRSVVVTTTTHASTEDDDGDGSPDREHSSDVMKLDASIRNPEKYALFQFEIK